MLILQLQLIYHHQPHTHTHTYGIHTPSALERGIIVLSSSCMRRTVFVFPISIPEDRQPTKDLLSPTQY